MIQICFQVKSCIDRMVLVKTENGTKIPMKVNLLAVDDLKRHGGVWEDIDRTIDQCF